MIIYFDTETTGLKPGRIVQLSYIIEDQGEITAKNFFFAVDYVPPEVVAIHGFSAERLKVLSNGLTFFDHIDEIYEDFCAADVVISHNVGFDLKFIASEFRNCGKSFPEVKTFDSMQYYKYVCQIQSGKYGLKFPKLTEVQSFLHITDRMVDNNIKKWFGINNINAHDARFDTTLLFMIVDEVKDLDSELHNYLYFN